jgi:tRNA dimethylallyltransferase
LIPISSASSSMHSWSIMVESMSAISIFFRRHAGCCTAMSTGSDESRERSSASISGALAPPGSSRSHATACASHTVLLAPTERAALCARLSEMARAFGLEMSVATSGMGTGGSLSGDGIIKDAVLIAGPTASGKSAMALDIALREGGIIVNADSMQVYSLLDVLTAQPTPDERRRVPHELYGHVHPSAAFSTGAWLRDVSRIAAEGRLTGRRPIFVGGTGLYFRALTEGISRMPDIPPDVRDHWRRRLREDGAEALHRTLLRQDPEMAAVLKPGDGQRIIRALEVLHASGRSISQWQSERGSPLVDRSSGRFIVIEPQRPLLIERIEARFERMIVEGAMAEVEALLALALDPALPAMKAIGVRELAMVIQGRATLAQAHKLASIATRQYAKRQSTWFRNQLGPEWQRVASVYPEVSTR